MKKSLFILIFSALYMFASAQVENYNYVVTDEDTIFCKEINVGAFKTRCKLDNGEKLIFSNKEVNQCLLDNKFTKRLPVYLNNEEFRSEEMMELVLFKNGVSTYRYEYYNCSNDCIDAVFNYYVGDKLVGSQKNPTAQELKDIVAINAINKNQQSKEIQLVQK